MPDIEDAEFVTVSPSASGHVPNRATQQYVGTKKREGTPLPLFALIATLASGASFYIAGGHVLFHNGPSPVIDAQRASTVPQFTLDNVSTRIDTGRGIPVFVIRGIIDASDAGGIIPNLSIEFTNDETGQRVTYTIPRGELLQANESLGFTTRIPAGNFSGSEPTITLEGS
ncbi:MAG: hypothetical protein AAFR71_13580 [Pseudomonadota bacterium]